VANCSSEGLPPTFSASTSVQVISAGGADAGLFAETSKNLTYGIILEPEISDSTNMILTIDYFDIEISNGVDKAGAATILPLCYDTQDFYAGGGYCRQVSRNPVSPRQLTVLNPYTNISTNISRGIDVDLTFDQDLPLGVILTNINMTRYYAQEERRYEGDPLKEFNGSLNRPKYGATANIGYELANWKLTYGVEWISSMSGYKEAKENPETSRFDLEVPSYFEHRLSLRYKTDNWKTTLGVRNLTNETPPEISAGSLFSRVGNSPLYSGYDYVGRELFVNFQINL
jgi:outer membrane receptor protein involved in Fe transport